MLGADHIEEYIRVRGSRKPCSFPALQVCSHVAGCGRGQGPVSRLLELAFPDLYEAVPGIDIAKCQIERLADPHAGGVEKDDQRGDYQRPQTSRPPERSLGRAGLVRV